jgi:hypothetical protein
VDISFPDYIPPKNTNLDNEEYIRLFNQCVGYYNSRRYSHAITPLSQIVEKYDDKGKSLHAPGVCYLSLEEYDKAIPLQNDR